MWSLPELWLGAILLFALVVVAVALSVVFIPFPQEPDFATPISQSLAYALLAASASMLFIWNRRLRFTDIAGPPPTFLNLLLAVVGLTIALSLSRAYYSLAPGLVPFPQPAYPSPQQFPLLLAFSTVVAAPVTEEFLFRGILFPGFSSHYSPLSAALLTSAIFTVWHLNLYSAPPIFIFALLASALRKLTGSIWAPTLMHSAFNAIILMGF